MISAILLFMAAMRVAAGGAPSSIKADSTAYKADSTAITADHS